MIVRNISNNTLYLSDVDIHIPYKNGEEEEFDPDLLKRSKCLRGFLIHDMLEIVKHNSNETIESSIVFLRNKAREKKVLEKVEEPEIIDAQPTELTAAVNELEVRIHGIFFDAGGYGKVNRNLALKLSEAGVKVKVDPKNSQNQLKRTELKDIIALTKTKLSKNHISIDSVIPSFSEYSTGKYRILYTTIESYTVPKQFLDCCQFYNEIWITCLEPSTIIETPHGPIEIGQINIGDYVISGRGEPKKVTDKKVIQHQGNIVEVHTKNGHRIKMTPWHRLYIRKTLKWNAELSTRPGYSVFTQREGLTRNTRRVIKYLACPPEYCRADNISTNDWVYFPRRHNWVNSDTILIHNFVSSKWFVNENELYSESLFFRTNTKKKWMIPRSTGIQDSLNINPEVAYFLGLYAAEGSNDGNAFSLVMSEEEDHILEKVQNTLEVYFGLSSKIRQPSELTKSLELRASSRLLCDFLTSVNGHRAPNKKVPSFLFTMSNDIKIAFLKGVLEGDGWITKNAIHLRVVSKRLRDGCVSLMYDLNLLPSISEDHKLRVNAKWNITSKHPTYSLRVGGKQFIESGLLGTKGSCRLSSIAWNHHIDDGKGLWHKVKKIIVQNYDGKVIDITVEDDQTFCIQSICSHNSEWSAGILGKVTKTPIYVIPAGVDHELYTEVGSRFDFKPNIKSFVFISVFGWSYRKGYDVLLKSYFDEFSARDDVSLLIVSRYQSQTSRFHRNRIKNDIEKIMEQFPNKDMPHVVRYSQTTPEEDMPKLYRSAHCFVLPTRGEGSNLCAPEASLCGLPLIMTNVSGQQMYLRKDNSFPIEMDRLEEMRPGQMHLHFWDGQKFPALTSDKVHNDLRQSMRYVFDNYDEAKKRNKKLQKLIKENFTWNNTANTALKRLQEIKEKMS